MQAPGNDLYSLPTTSSKPAAKLNERSFCRQGKLARAAYQNAVRCKAQQEAAAAEQRAKTYAGKAALLGPACVTIATSTSCSSSSSSTTRVVAETCGVKLLADLQKDSSELLARQAQLDASAA
jgi:hypothetical protein